MALKGNNFQVTAITDSESTILPENFGRILLYLKNIGDEDVYISKKASFDTATESLKIKSGENQIWYGSSLCPAEVIYAKCLSGKTSSLEIEEQG